MIFFLLLFPFLWIIRLTLSTLISIQRKNFIKKQRHAVENKDSKDQQIIFGFFHPFWYITMPQIFTFSVN